MYPSQKKKIEDFILSNMNVTREEFLSWQTKNYDMDNTIIGMFKDYIKFSDKIRIFGDYDCDGVTSSYIMGKLLERLTGFNVKVTPEKTGLDQKEIGIYLPRRFSDGYGMKKDWVEAVYEEDKKDILAGKRVTIVTVDNGIAAKEAVDRAKELGYTVILTDHHELGNNEIPDANICIDPKVKDYNPFDFDGYCGAGVAYKIAEKAGCFSSSELYHLKCFAALGTVCDVMPLIEENHRMVKEVLDEMSKGNIPKAFLKLGEKKITGNQKGFDFSVITETDFGFLFGPIVNASGRLNDDGAMQVLSFFLNPTDDIAEKLYNINEERKDIVKDEYDKVYNALMENYEPTDKISPVFVYVPHLHEGIVGILAGKLCEDLNQPAIVLTDDPMHEGIVKGSARSIVGFSIFDYLCKVQNEHPEYFAGFGGHDGAAGLSVNKEYIKDILSLRDEFEREDSVSISDIPTISIQKEDIAEAYQVIRKMAPFGEGNPEPIFKTYIHKYFDKPMFIGKDKNTMSIKRDDFNITCFRYNEKIGDKIQKLDLYGTLTLDTFQRENKPCLRVEYIEEHQKVKEKTIMEDKDFDDEEIDYSE